MKVRFKRLDPMATVPKRSTDGAAGYDLTATTVKMEVGKQIIYTVGTGIAMEIPSGYVGLVFPRSSVYKTGLSLCNCVGVIDSDYRGEITAKFYLMGNDSSLVYLKGERCLQLIIMPIPQIDFEVSLELSKTVRGIGGYGSTGVF